MRIELGGRHACLACNKSQGLIPNSGRKIYKNVAFDRIGLLPCSVTESKVVAWPCNCGVHVTPNSRYVQLHILVAERLYPQIICKSLFDHAKEAGEAVSWESFLPSFVPLVNSAGLSSHSEKVCYL